MANKFLCLVGTLATVALFVLSCSNGGSTSSSATTSGPTTTSAGTKPATTTSPATSKPPASGQTLAELLSKTASVASVKYNMVMTVPGSPVVNQAVFVKKNKMRTEATVQGQSTVLIIDADAKTMYTYMPAQNLALKMTWNPTSKSATEEAQSLTQYNPTILGTETIDGKVCLVVQYTVQGSAAKMWLWQERGMPVRVEATTPQGMTTIEYKSFEFVDIPDSMFTLPAGVQVSDMPGIGGMMPTGFPTGIPK